MSKRLEAAKAGETTYESKPCRRCKTKVRYTSSGQCVQCSRSRYAAYQEQIRRTLKNAKAGKDAP